MRGPGMGGWMGWLVLGGCASPDTGALERVADSGAVSGAPLQFRLPLADASRFSTVMGVDHDPVEHGVGISAWECVDYLGRAFPYCYDQHDGSDFILEGGFETMDAGSVEVVAAAAGVVVSTEDGHYDRCHADLTAGDVSCDGHEMVGNHVVVAHEGGYTTRYWHLKQGSVVVSVGASVEAGSVLGKVGSSGYSSMPHLHFELQDDAGGVIDPFAGPYSQEDSWWCAQNEPESVPGLCAS